MRGRLRGWLELPSAERWQFACLLLGLPVVSLLLATSGYKRTLWMIEALSRRAGQRVPSPSELNAAERLAQLSGLAGRHGPYPITCLRQALLTYLWLRWRRFSPSLKLGGRRQEGRFDAHAWVELEGRALGQAELLHQVFPHRSA